MKPTLKVTGKLTIVVLMCMLLLVHTLIEYKYFRNGGWLFATKVCAVLLATEKPLACFIPWWISIAATAGHFLVAMISLVRYRSLGRNWWYITAPAVVLLASLLVIAVIPLVHVEVSAAV